MEEHYLFAREWLDSAYSEGGMASVVELLYDTAEAWQVESDELLCRFLKHNVFLLNLEDVKNYLEPFYLRYYVNEMSKFGNMVSE